MEAHPVFEQEIQASQIIGRLEEAIEKASDAINNLEQGGDVAAAVIEEDLGLKGESWQQLQGFLQGKGKEKEAILKVLQDLIVFESGDYDDLDPIVTESVPLGPLGKLSLAMQAVSAYGYNLDPAHSHKINKRIQDDVTRWITHLFRLQNNNVFYHEDPLEGLLRLSRMVLHLRYPKYLEDGYKALEQQQPIFYGAVPNSLAVLQLLCRLLGLPLSCLNAVPPSAAGSMDLTALRQLIAHDVSSGKLPILVLSDAGSPITGHVDDLLQLQEICKEHNIWSHVRGHSLATLSLINSPIVPFTIADSVSLSMSPWLGLPSLPTCTLYRQLVANPSRLTGATREDTLPLIAGLVPDALTRRLVALPLWFVLQSLGREGLRDRVRACLNATHRLWFKISKLSSIRLLSRFPMCPEENLPLNELTSNPSTSPYSLFEITATKVVFQFVPEAQSGTVFIGRVPSYFDKLNSWMGQILQRDIPQVNIEVCDMENVGLVLRLCPLESVITMTSDDVDNFFSCLLQQLEILSATVRLKAVFQERVNNHPQLKLVEMPEWAGLGGVRYLPAVEEGADESMVPSIEELNKLNMELVAKLRSTDSAFSLGEGSDGMVCVRFGMVTADTDVEELLALVLAVGSQVEESARHLDTMVEIVKKGIETATLDLQKETEDRIWQDGILRHVPVFGSIVNWWAPKSTESGIKGRSLNLQAGVVESTENIYRYHMQLQQGAASPPGGKTPPQPQVQTPIVADVGKAHSRSSSHASHTSSTSTSNPPSSAATALPVASSSPLPQTPDSS